MATNRRQKAALLKNFIFGVEDSLVSTVGLLSGISFAGVAQSTIVLTGVVLVFVEALSMGAGSFLSESHSQEFENSSEAKTLKVTKGGMIMFISYFVAGFIPLSPYIFLTSAKQALYTSVGLSLIALFILGAYTARLSNQSAFKKGLRMLIIGGLAIIVGMLAARIVGAF
ncbi:MAG: VIT1/CCC1 transporter family protein [Candidatus Paceibacterota bacterium]